MTTKIVILKSFPRSSETVLDYIIYAFQHYLSIYGPLMMESTHRAVRLLLGSLSEQCLATLREAQLPVGHPEFRYIAMTGR